MLIPVILSGGAGTRLWPVSREGHPKPFMTLADGQTLIGKTYRRAARLADPGAIMTVTNRDYFFLSKDEFDGASRRAAQATCWSRPDAIPHRRWPWPPPALPRSSAAMR